MIAGAVKQEDNCRYSSFLLPVRIYQVRLFCILSSCIIAFHTKYTRHRLLNLILLRSLHVRNSRAIFDLHSRGEHGQDQDWISCRILAICLDQDWIWIFIFEKNWIRTGSGYLFVFYNEIFRRVIQDVTIDGAVVFFAMIFIYTINQNDFVSMCCTHHNR